MWLGSSTAPSVEAVLTRTAQLLASTGQAPLDEFLQRVKHVNCRIRHCTACYGELCVLQIYCSAAPLFADDFLWCPAQNSSLKGDNVC